MKFLKLNYILLVSAVTITCSAYAMRSGSRLIQKQPQQKIISKPMAEGRRLEMKKFETKKVETPSRFGQQFVSRTKLMSEQPAVRPQVASRKFSSRPVTWAEWVRSFFIPHKKVASTFQSFNPTQLQAIPDEHYLNQAIPVYNDKAWHTSNRTFLKKAIRRTNNLPEVQQEASVRALLDKGADPNFDPRVVGKAHEWQVIEDPGYNKSYAHSPIWLAVIEGNVGAVKALVDPKYNTILTANLYEEIVKNYPKKSLSMILELLPYAKKGEETILDYARLQLQEADKNLKHLPLEYKRKKLSAQDYSEKNAELKRLVQNQRKIVELLEKSQLAEQLKQGITIDLGTYAGQNAWVKQVVQLQKQMAQEHEEAAAGPQFKPEPVIMKQPIKEEQFEKVPEKPIKKQKESKLWILPSEPTEKSEEVSLRPEEAIGQQLQLELGE